MKTRIALLGPPASGKGTQAGMIQAAYGIEPTSPGAILREQKLAGTKLGLEADAYSREGRLAPDGLIVEVISSWLAPRDGAPFLFDGFPRSIGQADALEKLLAARRAPLDIAISLDAGIDLIRDRVGRRRICASCGNIVSLGLHVAHGDLPCPRCGGKLEGRSDDNMESLEVRMREYREKSEPVLAWYEERNLLETVNADQPVEAVFGEIAAALNK